MLLKKCIMLIIITLASSAAIASKPIPDDIIPLPLKDKVQTDATVRCHETSHGMVCELD